MCKKEKLNKLDFSNKIISELFNKIQLDFLKIDVYFPTAKSILIHLNSILEKYSLRLSINKTLIEQLGSVFLQINIGLIFGNEQENIEFVFPIQNRREGLNEQAAFWETVEFAMRAIFGAIFLGEFINMDSFNQCPIITAPYVMLLGFDEKRAMYNQLVAEIDKKYI